MLALSVSMSARGGSDRPSSSASAAARFLARYVTAEGSVTRYNPGGDVVSEGQV